jgi:hypothetical protein
MGPNKPKLSLKSILNKTLKKNIATQNKPIRTKIFKNLYGGYTENKIVLKPSNSFFRMTIIIKLNTFDRDSNPNQICTPLPPRSLHTTQSDNRQTTAMGSRLLCDALFVPQHHSHKLVTPRTPIYA